MQIEVDDDVKAVLEFMHLNVPAAKLLTVAEVIPKLARLLWSEYPQEPLVGVSLVSLPTRGSLPNASESGPALPCAGDGSVEAACVH